MRKSEIQAQLWGRSPNGWAEIQERLHQPLWEAMMDSAQVGKETTLLDVGCGAGWASAVAAERGATVFGIDIAEGLLAFAKERVENGKFQIADIQELPYKDNTFDVIFAANSLQYSEDRIATLREFQRVCKSGGKIVAGLFGEPQKVDYSSIFKIIKDAMPAPPKGKSGGPFELSFPGKLEGLFTESGLSNHTSHEVNCPFEYKNFESFWYGNASAGPFQGIINIIGEDKFKSVIKDAARGFTLDDGRIVIPNNVFKYVMAKI